MKIQKMQRKFELFARLQKLGFTSEECFQLYRIEMTLHRWAELECGGGNDFSSWSIERDETTGKPSMVIHPHSGKSYRYAVADREKGALKRLSKIIGDRNTRNWIGSGVAIKDSPGFVVPYHQTDCRGAALYLCTREQIGSDPIDSIYNRGIAVCV